ncbi:MAG TPA: XdhC family protein, partial [Casimicrobiaceae bacterium]|nr:XdhC family protein [Casimicrobiaceae bacterium]
MDSVDLDVLRKSAEWVDDGRRVLLVTVTKTWGSSPRPEGAMLAVREDGLVAGSVSGGCIEDDIVDRTRREGVHATKCEVVTYGISADEAHRFGLPCGGTIQLVLEPLSRESGIRALLREVETGHLVARRLDLASGFATLHPAQATDGLAFDGKVLRTIHGPRYRMLVIGASHLSRYLAEMAVGLGYEVTICDPREEYTETWDLPGVRLVRTMPDDTVQAMKLDERSAVVALTHDPKLDDLALMEALKSRAFYVGAIGSRANNEKRRERLREFDVTVDEIARLHGPI